MDNLDVFNRPMTVDDAPPTGAELRALATTPGVGHLKDPDGVARELAALWRDIARPPGAKDAAAPVATHADGEGTDPPVSK